MHWWLDFRFADTPIHWPENIKKIPVIEGRHGMDFDVDEAAMSEEDLKALWDGVAKQKGFSCKEELPINNTILPLGFNREKLPVCAIITPRS